MDSISMELAVIYARGQGDFQAQLMIKQCFSKQRSEQGNASQEVHGRQLGEVEESQAEAAKIAALLSDILRVQSQQALPAQGRVVLLRGGPEGVEGLGELLSQLGIECDQEGFGELEEGEGLEGLQEDGDWVEFEPKKIQSH